MSFSTFITTVILHTFTIYATNTTVIGIMQIIGLLSIVPCNKIAVNIYIKNEIMKIIKTYP
jgi:hypothetical protein